MKASDIPKIANDCDRLCNILNQNKRRLTDAETLEICNLLWDYYKPEHETYICNLLLDRYTYEDKKHICDLLREYKAGLLNKLSTKEENNDK